MNRPDLRIVEKSPWNSAEAYIDDTECVEDMSPTPLLRMIANDFCISFAIFAIIYFGLELGRGRWL